MISPKKLIKMARKWHKMAVSNRKWISFPRTDEDLDENNCSTSSVAEKGHFVVYTADQRRFAVPLAYLKNNIIIELFKMAEDVFGLPSDGPIILPCDEVLMEYAVSLIQRQAAKDVEKALLMSLATAHCFPSSHLNQDHINRQSLICSF